MAVLDDVTSEWRYELGNVDDDTVAWQPFPGGHSIAAIILHMADVEANWIYVVGAGKRIPDDEKELLLSEETDQYSVHWPTPPRHPLAWYISLHARVRERTRQVLMEINDPDHVGTRGSEQFTLRWLVNHIISHEAYHGGQAVFLSLMHEKSGA